MNGEQINNAITTNVRPSARPPSRGEEATTGTAYGLAIALAVVAGLIRLIPHPWNLTPVAALGIFGGARLRLWQAVTLPLVLMVVTDVLLWQIKGDHPFNPYVYGCFAVNIALGLLLRRSRSWLRIGATAVAASVLFFLVTNFGAWFGSRVDAQTLPAGAGMVMQTEGAKYPGGQPVYADNAKGLLACYFMGLNFAAKDAPPLGFTGNMLIGDLCFTGLLFGAYSLLARRTIRVVAKPQAAL
jgi:hypothetical protein